MNEGLRLIDNNNTLNDMFKLHQDLNNFDLELLVQDVMQYEIDIPPTDLNQSNELGDVVGDDLEEWGSIDNEEENSDVRNEEVECDENDHAFTKNEVQSDPKQLIEPSESEEEGVEIKFLEFVEDRDMNQPDHEVGLVFQNVGVFRKALRQYSVNNGFQLVLEKNEKNRVTAKRKNECGWRLHASFMGKSSSFQIKSLKRIPQQLS
ncbi:UNVERIFIED_CONTAM: hypothetical protein Sradi_0930400 [Sesamum radiatum]|uniref:Transposase MuDR plant domain-containing protein n=1 Tax=Sesamum radiatum TaxID=300843 RepID=A0AAW2V8L7_SESRA